MSEYREFGLELFSLDHSRRPKRPPMAEEKRDDGAGDPIKSLLEEALERQRNEMMDSFAQILQRVPQWQVHLQQAAGSGMQLPSRYKLTLIFLYLKAIFMQMPWIIG